MKESKSQKERKYKERKRGCILDQKKIDRSALLS